jgi:hypothetical protein
MGMQYGRTAWEKSQRGHETWTFSTNIQRYMQHKLERAVSTDMQHGQAAGIFSMNMQRRNAPRICITVM